MSPQDNSPEGNKPEGLSKYLKRMKTVLRTRSSSKRQSATPLETTKTTTPTPATNPTAEPAKLTSDYSAAQRDKASVLFAKYGLTLEPGEWKSPTDLPLARVTKPVRMRVRRTCHRCDTTFGPNKICINCQHPRCKKCPRFPTERTKDPAEPKVPKAKISELLARGNGGHTSHLRLSKDDPAAPLKLSSRTGGPDFIRKEVRHRTRRSCHACGVGFASGEKQCFSCNHVRCKKCPREPAKLEKYPDGYPGDFDPPKPVKADRVYKKARCRVHYICHVCSSHFNDDAKSCGKCGQAKCAETIRIPPKKIKREPDPEVLRQVEEKLAALVIGE
ncbi:hypothetical protein N7495_005313 [Penicillium taxi]|uniref:uncharacterized protein n=1 Tax=Penicillium taxi TaxID=168475 RepID=UPI002544F50E|nr:uncharacterized protein N7495_005313 [Penicillium taxi]KAJ5893622.1 hypothetical protein N7495_005313 [Penicillium taxi]